MFGRSVVSAQDRADIWEQLASIRQDAGDFEGADRARRLAEENRSLPW